MSGQGITLAQEGHVVNILPPIDANGAVRNSDVFSMRRYGHATIIVQVGVSGGAVSTVTVEECDDFVPTNATAIAFSGYKEETAAGDTLGAKVAATTAGFAMSTNNSIFYVIEIDARQLTDGYDNLRIVLTDPTASMIVSAVAVLSGSRFAHDQNETEIA